MRETGQNNYLQEGDNTPFRFINVGRAFGVWDESQGIELRGRFIIDPDGVIQAIEVLTPPVGRKFAETVRQIQTFQHVRTTKGVEATPAGLESGESTLKPEPDLVGKVWRSGNLPWRVDLRISHLKT